MARWENTAIPFQILQQDRPRSAETAVRCWCGPGAVRQIFHTTAEHHQRVLLAGPVFTGGTLKILNLGEAYYRVNPCRSARRGGVAVARGVAGPTALRPCWRSSTLRVVPDTQPNDITQRSTPRWLPTGVRPSFSERRAEGLRRRTETALERRPRPRTRLGCSQRAPRPTGLEQPTATLFTGVNVSATPAKFLRPVQQIVQRSCRLTTHRETQDRIAIEGY